jgi:Cys-rich protein (TIGR01571 family)
MQNIEQQALLPENHAGQWSSSLFACCDSCACCCACILPCFVLAQNVHRMQELGIKPLPVIDDCCLACDERNKPCAAGLLYFGGVAASFAGSILSPVHPYFSALGCFECGSVCFHALLRTAIAGHDDCCLNFCCALCCYSCALAQEQRHLDSLLAHHHQDVFIDENTQPPADTNTMRERDAFY